MLAGTSGADVLERAVRSETQTLSEAARSQKTIDRLDDASRQMLDEYRRTLRDIDILKTYTTHLKTLVASQQQEQADLEHQLQAIAAVEREIVPLMLHMIATLEQFVRLDVPFLPEERQQRVDQLKTMVDSAEVSTAEKFRRILEAYQIENDYAHTIEAYRSELVLDNERRPVDFLRVGRMALFYQTLDGKTSGFWSSSTNHWQTLPDEYLRPIRQGIRIARKEAAPDLLTLPLPPAEAVR